MVQSQQETLLKKLERHMNIDEEYFELNNFFQKNNFSKFKKSSFLITGGTGVLGYSLLTLLNKMGFENLHCITRSKPSSYNYLKSVNYHYIDLRDDNIKKKLDYFDYIIHSAGYAQPNKFLMDPLGVFTINVDATRELIKKCRKVFGFVSSSEIYSGNIGQLDENSNGKTNPQHKRACYIESKRSGEFLTSAFSSDLNIDAKIFRVSTAFGPGFSKNDDRVLTDFIRSALTKKKISVRAGANQIRQVNYNFDAAQKIIISLFFGKNNIYNISGTNKVTISDMAKIIAHQTGSTYKILTSSDDTGAPQLVDVIDKNFTKEFNFDIHTSFDQIIQKSIHWFKKIHQYEF